MSPQITKLRNVESQRSTAKYQSSQSSNHRVTKSADWEVYRKVHESSVHKVAKLTDIDVYSERVLKLLSGETQTERSTARVNPQITVLQKERRLAGKTHTVF